MNIADQNRLILRTINTRGYDRAEGRKAVSFAALVDATGMDPAILREALAVLCGPAQFRDAVLLHLPGDVYAQPIVMVGFDYHQVCERTDGRFDVLRSRKIVSTHDSVDAACDAASEADHAHVYGHRVACRPVDATFHGRERNAYGEAVCLPDR